MVRPGDGIIDRKAIVHLVHIQPNIVPTTLSNLDQNPDRWSRALQLNSTKNGRDE
jgi:hypothetical protein